MAEESRASWMTWAVVIGTFTVCCGLPFIALGVAAGGVAAALTGTLGVAVGALAVAIGLGGIYFARRRTLLRKRSAQLTSQFSQGRDEPPGDQTR